MAAPAVVKDLEVLEDRALGRLPGREGRAVHELGLEAAEEALHGRVVPAVALAAHRLDEPVPGQDRPVVLASVLGGFKWSSQHLDQGGCGGPSKAAFGSVPARRVAVPGPPLRGAAGGSAPVLGVDRGGTLERGRRSWRRRGSGSRDTLVPGGGRHATVTSLAVVE